LPRCPARSTGCAGRIKKSLAASERDEAARAAWREEVSHLNARQLIFVDESGTHVALTPLYAWAPKVQRARVPGAAQPWENYHQAFCPLASQGSRRASPIEGGTDARAFATSVREVLAPTLEPGQIVILDKPFCAPG
jgi:hypothetical protein